MAKSAKYTRAAKLYRAAQAHSPKSRSNATRNAGSQRTGPTPGKLQSPAPQTNTVQPFLTPAQQLALGKWNNTYGSELIKLGNTDTQALAKFTDTYNSDVLKNAQTGDVTNQAMAARGLGQSSIRDNALNDLAATLASQYNILHTNYQTTLMNDATARNTLAGDNATEQTFYNGLAIENAQSIPPAVQTPAQTQQGAKQPTQTQKPGSSVGPRTNGPKTLPKPMGGPPVGVHPPPMKPMGGPPVGVPGVRPPGMRAAATIRAGGGR